MLVAGVFLPHPKLRIEAPIGGIGSGSTITFDGITGQISEVIEQSQARIVGQVGRCGRLSSGQHGTAILLVAFTANVLCSRTLQVGRAPPANTPTVRASTADSLSGHLTPALQRSGQAVNLRIAVHVEAHASA